MVSTNLFLLVLPLILSVGHLLSHATTVAALEGEADWRDTPLHDAVRADDPEAVASALASSPSFLDQRGPGGQTPLMMGCLMGKARAVAALLASGADVGIGEKDGYTPMHGAAFQGRADVARILIDHGLDPKELHTDG